MKISPLGDPLPIPTRPGGEPPGKPSVAPPPKSEVRQPAQPADQNAVKAAVDAANRAMRESGSALEFVLDTDTKRLIVRIVDTESKKVIRQFPSEEMLAIARHLDRASGKVVDGVA
jgi:flagellar protein FlaG